MKIARPFACMQAIVQSWIVELAKTREADTTDLVRLAFVLKTYRKISQVLKNFGTKTSELSKISFLKTIRNSNEEYIFLFKTNTIQCI